MMDVLNRMRRESMRTLVLVEQMKDVRITMISIPDQTFHKVNMVSKVNFTSANHCSVILILENERGRSASLPYSFYFLFFFLSLSLSNIRFSDGVIVLFLQQLKVR